MDDHLISDERYRLLTTALNCIGEGIITTGPNGKILYMNDSAAQMTGSKTEEVIGKVVDSVFSIIKQGTNEEEESFIKLALKAKIIIRLQKKAPFSTKSDNRKYVYAKCSPIQDENGIIEGIIILLHNQQIRQDLQVENNNMPPGLEFSSMEMLGVTDELVINHATKITDFYLRVFENFPIIIIRTDAFGRCVYANKHWREFVGQVSAENIGHDWKDYAHPDDKHRISGERERDLDTHDLYDTELRMLNKNREYQWIHNISTPFYNMDGKFGGYISIGIDIHQRKLIEEQLKHAKNQAEVANRAKSEFLANMSHEIRTPINGVIGMIDLTLLTHLDHKQRENLEIAKSCVNSLLRIINDILDFSKLEAGKMMMETIVFDIKELIIEIIKSHGHYASDKGIKLNYTFVYDLPQFLTGDPNRIKQVINNLISKAIKFTKEGEISLSVEKIAIVEDWVDLKFAIMDTGIGIAQDEMIRLFKSFSQIDSSITRNYGGTGLGLIISKQLVEMMGGKLWVESEKGKGSVFYFNVIFKIGVKPAEKAAASLYTNKIPIELSILLVEDDPVNQEIVTQMLREKNYKVDIADNGLEALVLYREQKYDMVLMDIQMPGIDGIETTRRIREVELETGEHIPIIALTAYAMKGDREKFLSLGMDEYLAKPIQVVELLDTIGSIWEQSKREEPFIIRGIKVGEDGEVVFELKNSYAIPEDLPFILSKIADKMEELFHLLADNHFNEIEMIAHKLKQLLEEVDGELKNTAFKIELAARRGDLQEVFQKSTQLKHGFETYKHSIGYMRG